MAVKVFLFCGIILLQVTKIFRSHKIKQKHPMENKKTIAAGLALFVVVSFAGILYLFKTTVLNPRVTPISDVATVTPPPVIPDVAELPKVALGETLKTDLPTNLPLIQEATLDQSYRLDYPDQKQSTGVFLSEKTVKENYALYEAFLNKEGWTIINNYESDTLSSLYALKENDALNITISRLEGDTPKQSEVSVSILKK